MTTRPLPAPTALAMALGILAAPAAAPAQPPAAGRAALDSSVRAVYQRFLDGLRRRDTTAYRDLLTPGYVHVAGDTATVTVGRSARLRWDLAQEGRITVFEARRCDVQPYGDAAVGPCWYHIAGVSAGKPFEVDGVSLTTFVRGADRRWRIAATRPSLARDVPR